MVFNDFFKSSLGVVLSGQFILESGFAEFCFLGIGTGQTANGK
jgi:hypothetical protein